MSRAVLKEGAGLPARAHAPNHHARGWPLRPAWTFHAGLDGVPPEGLADQGKGRDVALPDPTAELANESVQRLQPGTPLGAERTVYSPR